jgi:hypothetical protein
LRARQDADEWVIDGVAPWVSGWELNDLIHVAARTPDDDVVWLLVDEPSEGMHAEPLRLLAVKRMSFPWLSLVAGSASTADDCSDSVGAAGGTDLLRLAKFLHVPGKAGFEVDDFGPGWRDTNEHHLLV